MAEQPLVLSSWEDIANHVGKGVRTVQRWELERGLPVRPPHGHTSKSEVLLYRDEAGAWMAKQHCLLRRKGTSVLGGQSFH
jgi:hypothetical protein